MSRVLVLGDIIGDLYRTFRYRKQCPDSPSTPVGVSVESTLLPGGAANVALNVAALAPNDCQVDLMGVLDWELFDVIARSQVWTGHSLLVDPASSIRKERIAIIGPDESLHPPIARLDNRTLIDVADARMIVRHLEGYLRNEGRPDLIVVSDYACGVLTDHLIDVLRPHMDRVLVDTKRRDLSVFSGAMFAKLNLDEHSAVLITDPMPERHFRYYVVTRGSKGATLSIRRDLDGSSSSCITGEFRPIETDAIDVCGCGDTFLAGLAAGMIRYDDPFEATIFANCAASTVVSRPRTAVADLHETLLKTGRKT